MKTLLHRLRLCALLLLAHRARDWRWLAAACDDQATAAGYRAMLAAIDAAQAECLRQQALETEIRQILRS